MADRWLLYGAYGYTGRLIAREALAGKGRAGPGPVLAGRDPVATRKLADELGLDHRVFSLDDGERVRESLSDVALVLSSAGPFSRTFRPMAEACLTTGTHYLDVTGELGVLEAAHRMDERARRAGVLLVPAVGLDVVPTDCLAARAAELLPDARELDLALVSDGGPSRGTARTMVERLGEPSKIRREGRIVDVPQGAVTRTIPFSDGERHAVCIPWGDVSTAYHSTGIPEIRVFLAAPPSTATVLEVLSTLFRIPGAPRLASWIVKHTVIGPGEETLREGRTRLWGEVRAPDGRAVVLELSTPNGYVFTARSAVAAVRRVLDGEIDPGGGFRTPSAAFGADFVETIDGVEWIRSPEAST